MTKHSAPSSLVWTFVDLSSATLVEAGFIGDCDEAWSRADDHAYERQSPIWFKANDAPKVVDLTQSLVFPKDLSEFDVDVK